MDINPSHKIFIVQKVIVLNSKNNILVIRRSDTAKIRPLGWDLPGGSLEFGEDPKKVIKREIEEETGINTGQIELLDITSFLEEDKYTLMIGYTAYADKTDVKLSFEHDLYKWSTKDDFLNSDIPDTYKNFLKKI